MQTTTPSKKQKIVRMLFGTLSLSSAIFVFQACYGPPRDMGLDVHIQGTVKSSKTNLPIKGIKVSIDHHSQYTYSDTTGHFDIYTEKADTCIVKFEDINTDKNGSFTAKDTMLNIKNPVEIVVSLDPR